MLLVDMIAETFDNARQGDCLTGWLWSEVQMDMIAEIVENARKGGCVTG